ncbi:ribbon-helix-helix protein, copG family [bacterium BMS3Abin10]|nr:ribbon-helix-helix protein, copG family [bacterium BMS3Abin10]GBE38651.1 ribbon-helix-helix protein, copG family [bacterium BMS3Bbin08]
MRIVEKIEKKHVRNILSPRQYLEKTKGIKEGLKIDRDGKTVLQCNKIKGKEVRIMRTSVSVSLPEKLNRDIDKILKETSLTRSELVRAALDEYLFKFRFRKIREKLVMKARSRGIYTDDDVYERLS